MLTLNKVQNCNILEGLAPYGGQTSSSCGGLVAFGHQMGALRAPWTNTNSYIAQIQIGTVQIGTVQIGTIQIGTVQIGTVRTNSLRRSSSSRSRSSSSSTKHIYKG